MVGANELRSLLWGDFMIPGAEPPKYDEIEDMKTMEAVVNDHLVSFNAGQGLLCEGGGFREGVGSQPLLQRRRGQQPCCVAALLLRCISALTHAIRITPPSSVPGTRHARARYARARHAGHAMPASFSHDTHMRSICVFLCARLRRPCAPCAPRPLPSWHAHASHLCVRVCELHGP